MYNNVRRKLRESFANKSEWPLFAPTVYDVATTRIAEMAGFQAVVVSGYAVSATKLGRPDAGYLALPELVSVVSQMSIRCTVPLIVDADTGFGNALGVMRTVEELIAAGAAALFIEDQIAPKRCGHVAGKQVVPPEEFVGKIRAANDVRNKLAPELLLIARTDARGVAGGSLEEVIQRGILYREAGADILLPEGLISREEIEECGKRTGLPFLYNMAGISPILPYTDLAKYGVFLVSSGVVALQASLKAIWDTLHQLKIEGAEFIRKFYADIASHPVGDLHSFVGFPEVRNLEEKYLPAEEIMKRYDGSLGYNP